MDNEQIIWLVVAVIVWGAAFGGILNLVQVWISRVLPDRMEAGSGLVVGGFQLAIIVGSGTTPAGSASRKKARSK